MEPSTEIIIGKNYYRKRTVNVTVRRVDDIFLENGKVFIKYTTIFKSSTSKRQANSNSINQQVIQLKRNFIKWATDHFDDAEYSSFEALLGCRIYKSYIVLTPDGVPVFRCSQKRADFYLQKNYAIVINDETVQLTNSVTIDSLLKFYPNFHENPFFMAKKNSHCVVCGKTTNLSRHHVIPKRYKSKLPKTVRQCISNVLFICIPCHHAYEIKSPLVDEKINQIDDPIQRVRTWEKHFYAIMKPKHMPRGWHLLTRTLDSVSA